MRGKTWYFPQLADCVDIAVHNAWQIYKKSGGVLDQLKFRRRIAVALLQQNTKPSWAIGHCSRNEGIDIRFDRMDHFVIPQEKQIKCTFCQSRTTTRCRKCNKDLHVTCFASYHSPS